MEKLIFRPTKQGLAEARRRRLKKWKELEERHYTIEEQLERMRVDIEVFNDMEMLKERANQYIV